MMKIAIVDDVEAERNILKKYIGEWATDNKEIVELKDFSSSEAFLFTWEEDKGNDLLVLDIEMGEMNGFELAKKIRIQEKNIPIMFVTGYDDYMQYGYDLSVLHYLLKPVSKERLGQALDKLKSLHMADEKSLILNTADEIKRIAIKEIMYAEAAGHGCILHTLEEVLSLKKSLGELEKQVMDFTEIIKCHRAYIVNLRYVSAIKNSDLILDNKEVIPVSRNQMKNVQMKFLNFYKKG